MIKFFRKYPHTIIPAIITTITVLITLWTTFWAFLIYVPEQKALRRSEVNKCYQEGGIWQRNSNSSDACWIDGKLQWFSKY